MIPATILATIQFEFLTLAKALVLGGQIQKNLIYQKLGNCRFECPEGLAEGVGFEPTVRSPARRFSRPVP